MKFLLSAAILFILLQSISAQPSAPSNLVVANGSGNDISLSWSDNSSNETSFKIERKLGVSGTYSQVDTTATNVAIYSDTSAKTANRPYIYRVRASNGSGDSSYSNEDDAVTPFTGTINNYKTDTANYSETPVTMPLPLAGGKFYDETFGTKIMRFTGESDGTDFGTTYAVWRTINSNNTKLWIFNSIDNNYYIGTLNPTTFARVGALQTVPPAPGVLFVHYESANWSGIDPDKIFITVDAKLYFYRPSTNAYTLVKDFTSVFPAGYYFIQLYVSDDDDRFGVMIRNGSSDQGFIVYDLSEDAIKLDVRTTDMNGITMDKSGAYVYYVADTPFTTKVYSVATGIGDTLVSDPSTGEPDRQVGHNDAGNNLLVGEDQWDGGITSRNMSTPHSETLAWQYAPYWINFHNSMRADNDNWTLLSTYGEVNVSADSAKYKRELFQVGVRSPVLGSLRRLVHSRSNWSIGGTKVVSGATNASPIVITTSTAHGFQTGQRIQMSSVGGNTAANGFFYITIIDSDEFSLNGSSGNGVYTSGGQAYLETYWWTPRANVSRDGKYIFWTSDWNGIPGGSRNDLYIAEIVPADTAGVVVKKCNWNISPRCNQ